MNDLSMSTFSDLPSTPDFDIWPIEHAISVVDLEPQALKLTWSDGAVSQHHVLLLRENSPDAATTHPKAREMAISPDRVAANVALTSAAILDNGSLAVSFSDGLETAYHPGWLRGTAWFGEDTNHKPILWRGSERSEPPSFHGPETLEKPELFLAWLEALKNYGVARLRDLPCKAGLLEDVVNRIGPIRESNFDRVFVLEIKDDPDSQAYTSESLPQHIDLPTRETPFGLQFLFTRINTVRGGEGIYVDAYQVAEDMRREEPDHFHSLTHDVWEYNNRAKTTDHRGFGSVVETDDQGVITGIRYNTFLRAPMKAPLDVQGRAYKAYRAFCERVQSPRYEMRFRYEPGDLLAFDNRRVLHGRASYVAASGSRFIEGTYSDRDELGSRIRILQRTLRAQGTGQ